MKFIIIYSFKYFISYFVNLNAWKVDALIQVESIHELAADDTAKPPVKADGTQDKLPF